MALKRPFKILFGTAAVVGILVFACLYLLPYNILPIQQKPEQTPKAYDYYIIVDEETDQSLMYVPVVVNIGDEVLSEDNKRYRVVKVVENKAYARYVQDIDLEKYKPKKQDHDSPAP